MKIHRKESLGMTLFLLAMICLFVLTSLTYGKTERLMPLTVGIVSLILCVLVLLGELFPALIKGFDVSVEDFLKKNAAQPDRQPGQDQDRGRQVIKACAWAAGFVVLIYLAGFLIAIPLYLISFLKIQGRAGWITTILITALTWGFIYGLFQVVLKVALFKGLLFGAL